MYEVLYENFKRCFPSEAREVEEWRPAGMFELFIKLRDGRKYLYDENENAIRRLPNDPNSLSEDECRNEFGRRLYRIMWLKGVTQLELSQMTGISQSIISGYMTGKHTPSFYNVDKIAKALNLSMDELRYFE